MGIVRVTWNDAITQWPSAWQEARDIGEGLETTLVETVGYSVEIDGRDDYVVVASSKSGSIHTLGGIQYGGVTAIPRGMVTNIEIID